MCANRSNNLIIYIYYFYNLAINSVLLVISKVKL